jgi:hypothetical protein
VLVGGVGGCVVVGGRMRISERGRRWGRACFKRDACWGGAPDQPRITGRFAYHVGGGRCTVHG